MEDLKEEQGDQIVKMMELSARPYFQQEALNFEVELL